jgi:hypothetical protein
MTKLLLASLLIAGVAMPLRAQTSNALQADQQMQKMQLAMADAQAKASRPGDTRMSCAEMQQELEGQMRQPAVRAAAAANGAIAKEKLDELDKAKSEASAQVATQMASNLFMGFASAFMPGMGMITGRAQQAQMQAKAAQDQAKAQQNAQDIAKMADSMIAILPQMMRGNHMMELAQAKNCDWIKQPGASPPQR